MKWKGYIWIALPFLLGGLGLCAAAGWRSHRALDSLGWPYVEGRVSSSRVEELTTIEGTVRYRPRIRFTYAVGDTSHESDRHTFGAPDTLDGELAYTLVDRYKADAPVHVYINPNDPADAVMQPGDRTGVGRTLGTGLFLMLLGLLALGRGMWRARIGARDGRR